MKISNITLRGRLVFVAIIGLILSGFYSFDVHAAEGPAPCNGKEGAPHVNGGGFVAVTAQVSPEVYLGPQTRVCDRAVISGNVRLEDEATVYGDAKVFGTREPGKVLLMKDRANVYDFAELSGEVTLTHAAWVAGHARVRDRARLIGNLGPLKEGDSMEGAGVDQHAEVSGDATMSRWAYATGYSKTRENAVNENGNVRESAILEGSATVRDSGDLRGFARVYGQAIVSDNALVAGYAQVRGRAQVGKGSIVTGRAIVEGNYKGKKLIMDRGVKK